MAVSGLGTSARGVRNMGDAHRVNVGAPGGRVAQAFHASTIDGAGAAPRSSRRGARDGEDGDVVVCLRAHFSTLVLGASLVVLLLSEAMKDGSPGLASCNDPSFRPCVYDGVSAFDALLGGSVDVTGGRAGAVGATSNTVPSGASAICVYSPCPCPVGMPDVQHAGEALCSAPPSHAWEGCGAVPRETIGDTCYFQPLVEGVEVEYDTGNLMIQWAQWILGFGTLLSAMLAQCGRECRHCGGGGFTGVGETGRDEAADCGCVGWTVDFVVPPLIGLGIWLAAFDFGDTVWWCSAATGTLIVLQQMVLECSAARACCAECVSDCTCADCCYGTCGRERYVPREGAPSAEYPPGAHADKAAQSTSRVSPEKHAHEQDLEAKIEPRVGMPVAETVAQAESRRLAASTDQIEGYAAHRDPTRAHANNPEELHHHGTGMAPRRR